MRYPGARPVLGHFEKWQHLSALRLGPVGLRRGAEVAELVDTLEVGAAHVDRPALRPLAPLALARPRPAVLVEEQAGEQAEVAAVHGQPELVVGRHHGARALAHGVDLVAHARQHRHPAHHLQDLDGGDEGGEGAHDVEVSDRGHAVVEVHNGVHGEVHGREPDARRDAVVEGVPAVEQDGDVVEPVQEDDLRAGGRGASAARRGGGAGPTFFFCSTRKTVSSNSGILL
jgi:hypothetical protein